MKHRLTLTSFSGVCCQCLVRPAGTIDWRTSTLAGDEYQADKKESQVDKKEPAAEDSGSEQPSRPLVLEGPP